MKDYVESLVDSLFDMYLSNITFNSKIESIDLDMEQSVPLGLIINELVTNTIKYAFPNDKEGKLYIEFRKKGKNYTLIFKDNGVGLPDDFDLNNLNGLGLMVVQNLTLQLGGTMVVMDCEGTGFKIEFDEN
jgi:two-component sensor histidine kinase